MKIIEENGKIILIEEENFPQLSEIYPLMKSYILEVAL